MLVRPTWMDRGVGDCKVKGDFGQLVGLLFTLLSEYFTVYLCIRQPTRKCWHVKVTPNLDVRRWSKLNSSYESSEAAFADPHSTLFWGGKTYAPAFKIKNQEGKMVNIQTYLQDAFFGAVGKLVDVVGDLPGVLGFEVSFKSIFTEAEADLYSLWMNLILGLSVSQLVMPGWAEHVFPMGFWLQADICRITTPIFTLVNSPLPSSHSRWVPATLLQEFPSILAHSLSPLGTLPPSSVIPRQSRSGVKMVQPKVNVHSNEKVSGVGQIRRRLPLLYRKITSRRIVKVLRWNSTGTFISLSWSDGRRLLIRRKVKRGRWDWSRLSRMSSVPIGPRVIGQATSSMLHTGESCPLISLLWLQLMIAGMIWIQCSRNNLASWL